MGKTKPAKPPQAIRKQEGGLQRYTRELEEFLNNTRNAETVGIQLVLMFELQDCLKAENGDQ